MVHLEAVLYTLSSYWFVADMTLLAHFVGKAVHTHQVAIVLFEALIDERLSA